MLYYHGQVQMLGGFFYLTLPCEFTKSLGAYSHSLKLVNRQFGQFGTCSRVGFLSSESTMTFWRNKGLTMLIKTQAKLKNRKIDTRNSPRLAKVILQTIRREKEI